MYHILCVHGIYKAMSSKVKKCCRFVDYCAFCMYRPKMPNDPIAGLSKVMTTSQSCINIAQVTQVASSCN